MNYEEMKNIVLEQSAKDMMCDKNEFLKNGITVVSMAEDEKSQNRGNKKSIPDVLFCNFVYFGKSLVCTCDLKVASQIQNLLENELNKNELYRIFEPEFIYKLNEILQPFNKRVNCMANFCLPSKNFFETKTPSVNIENFSFKFFYDKEIASLYDEKGFDSALDYGSCISENPKIRKDKIALVAYVDDKIVGIAACTDDCDSMWQIGIDVFPEFRGKNIASFLVNKLSHKIFELGKIPYYCTAWSNIASRNTAIKAGFIPSWVEIASVESL
jgi:hypothetical protein